VLLGPPQGGPFALSTDCDLIAPAVHIIIGQVCPPRAGGI